MNEIDRTRVSFAEAEGKAKFPPLLQWGAIDQRLRAAVWAPIYSFLKKHTHTSRRSSPFYSLTEPALSIFRREFLDRRHGFIDDYNPDFYPEDGLINQWKKFFLSADYVQIFDFVTFLVRDEDCPPELIAKITQALDQPFSPYRLSAEAKTIFPAIGKEETESLQKDMAIAFSSSFSGSKTHLQSALSSLGESNYRTSVRESIHAVESAVRDFTGDNNAILSRAIKSLVAEMGVHRALGDAFDKLYAYSSDESGIRHALVFGENEKVGLDEAAFFLSACTAFVGFLARKKQAQSSKSAGT